MNELGALAKEIFTLLSMGMTAHVVVKEKFYKINFPKGKNAKKAFLIKSLENKLKIIVPMARQEGIRRQIHALLDEL